MDACIRMIAYDSFIQIALEGQGFPRMYLAHHGLESSNIISKKVPTCQDKGDPANTRDA